MRSRNLRHLAGLEAFHNTKQKIGNQRMSFEGIVAVGLLTRNDLEVLGPSFTRVWPVDQTPCFDGLLRAIDDAERELRRSPQDREQA